MDNTPQYSPEEFFPFLENLPKRESGQAVICGGQAVNLLAALFLTEKQIETILGEIGSATSSDMDIMITPDFQKRISAAANKSKEFSLQTFADCRQPIQFAIMLGEDVGLPDSRIDVLRSVKGIHTQKDRVFEDALELDDVPYQVMNPTTLLIAKAENCATLEQDSPTQKRNDINHLRLLILIVHNYLRELVNHCRPDFKDEQRDIIRSLKKIRAASQKTNFKKGMKLAKVNLLDAVPIKPIQKSNLETLRKYLNNTFLEAPDPPDSL